VVVILLESNLEDIKSEIKTVNCCY